MLPQQQDTGWAWVILFAATVWNFIVGGTLKTYGMLYVEFQTVFDNTPSQVGLMGLVCGLLSIVVSPLAGHLSDRYPTRTMALVGSVLATLAMALTGQARSLLMAILSYGVMFGFSLGLTDGPVLSMLGKYFNKRRNFACGIAFAGSSLGNVAIAQIMAAAIDAYTIRGAMLILAAVWAHTAVLAALLRPVKVKSPQSPFVCNLPRHSFPSIDLKELPDLSSTHPAALPRDQSRDCSYAVTPCDLPEGTEKQVCDDHLSDNDIQQLQHLLTVKEKNDAVSDGSVKDIPTSVRTTGKYNLCTNNRPTCRVIKPKWCLCSLRSLRHAISSSSYLSFLRNPKLFTTLFLLGCGMYGYYSLITAVPAYMKERGFDRHQTAWFMFALGSVEILSRVVISWVIDAWKWSPGLVLCSSMFITGITGTVFVFHPTYPVILCYACVHGCFGGLSLVLMSSLLCECAGVEQLGSSMGLAVMQLNLTAAISSLTAGLMQELTGSYVNAIRLSAAIYILGCSVYGVTSLLFAKFRSRRSNSIRVVVASQETREMVNESTIQ